MATDEKNNNNLNGCLAPKRKKTGCHSSCSCKYECTTTPLNGMLVHYATGILYVNVHQTGGGGGNKTWSSFLMSKKATKLLTNRKAIF